MSRFETTADDLSFLVSEINRFLEDGPEIIRSKSGHKEDFLCTLKNPLDGRVYIWGVEAERRCLTIIRERVLVHPLVKGKVDIESARDAFKHQLSMMLFGRHQVEICERFFQKLCGRVISYLRKSFKEVTHFVPCNLIADEDMRSFSVGPVKFNPMAEWLDQNSQRIGMAKNNWDAAGVGEHLNNFLWMAEVSVAPCSVVVSRERAHTAVNGAVNILRMYLPLDYARKFRTTRTWKDHKELDGIWLIDDALNWHCSIRFAPIASGWNEFVSDPGVDFQVAASALSAYVSETKSSSLRDRFLDGLYWMGDACDDWRESAIIVKLAAALERFTKGPKKYEDIQLTVSERAAVIANRYFRSEFEGCKEKVRRIYDARSRLMHGDSTRRSDVGISSFESFEVTKLIARAAVLFFAELDAQGFGEKELDEEFKKLLEERAKRS